MQSAQKAAVASKTGELHELAELELVKLRFEESLGVGESEPAVVEFVLQLMLLVVNAVVADDGCDLRRVLAASKRMCSE